MNMAATRNKNSPVFRIALLAAILSAAGCASLSSPESSDAQKSAALAKSAKKAATGNNEGKGDDHFADRHGYKDIWERIRAGYAMPEIDSPLVARHEQWFQRNPEYIENLVGRARFYIYYIVEEVEKRGMPMEIALLPAIESAYMPQAYSRARAVGLWQFIQSTGRVYGLESNWWYDGRRDVIASTRAALDYLEKLHNQFGDWQLALAAYNCGEGKVERLVSENRRKGLPTDYTSLKRLPRETANYVPRLMAVANIVADPAKYNLQLASIPNEEYFARIVTDSQIDLGVVAKLADMPVNDLFMINPGYQRWITDPNRPHELLVPADKKETLLEGLSKLNDEERVQWARHQVKRGDTISRIATHYKVTVEAIRTSNKMSSNHLAVGQNLLIPVSANKAVSVPPPTYVARTANPPAGATGNRVKIVHQVRAGDTLWSIARKYKVYVQQLREWNLLDGNDALRLGQRLHIWTVRSNAAAATPPADAPHPG